MKRLFMCTLGTLLVALAVGSTPAEEQTTEPTHPVVLITTNMGTIEVELYEDKAPISVQNFLQYVDDGQYDGTVFHRVMSGFMIQGGGFDQMLSKKPTRAPIKNEANNGLSNETGTISMARTPDPHGASSQFFINTADNKRLDHRSPDPRGWGYAVFGQVVSGMKVVRKIEASPTRARGVHGNVPSEPVIIESIRRRE